MSSEFKIGRKSLAEEVAIRLRESVESGHFAVGDKLPAEAELMTMCGVGRSTIREAIKVLANSGLLTVKQGLGTFVAARYPTSEPISQRLKRAPFNDIDEVRQTLEMKIAEIAAKKRTKRDLKNIEKCLAEIEEADKSGSLERSIDSDILFHKALAEASHNALLAELYGLASEHLRKWYRKIYTSADIFASALDLHRELYSHIKEGDSKKAWNVAEAIIRHGRV